MNKKSGLLSLFFVMAMVVGCSTNNTNSVSDNNSQSSTVVTPNISTSSGTKDDYVTPIGDSFSYESLATSEYRDFLSLTYGDWKFHKGELANGEKVTKYDSTWSDVTLPHTWNKTDGQDGGGNYARCESWYHHKVTLGEEVAINGIDIQWYGGASTKTYTIEVSTDKESWDVLEDVTNASTTRNRLDEYTFETVTVRYVKVYGTTRVSTYGYSIDEIYIWKA